MRRKKITPALKGTIEFDSSDESSKFDKYPIRVNNVLIAFLYLPKNAGLIPKSISFVREIEIVTEY